jgi:hypothetical protein
MYVNEWPIDEVSTRNCFKCKVKGQMVTCPEGINAFYKAIVKYPARMSKCFGCTKFEDFSVSKSELEIYWDKLDKRKN